MWLVRSAKKARMRVILLVAAHKCSHSQNSSKACTLYSALHKGETCKDPHNNALALSIWDNLWEKKKPTGNQQTNKPSKTKFLNILYPYSFVANINNPGTRHLIKNLQPKLNLQSTILPYI